MRYNVVCAAVVNSGEESSEEPALLPTCSCLPVVPLHPDHRSFVARKFSAVRCFAADRVVCLDSQDYGSIRRLLVHPKTNVTLYLLNMDNRQHDQLEQQCRASIDGPMTPERFDENGWQVIDSHIHAPCGCKGKIPISFIPADPGIFPSNERLLFGGFIDCGKSVDYYGGTGCVFCEKDRAKSFADGLPYNREVWAWYQSKTGVKAILQ